MLEYVKFTSSAYKDKNAKETVRCRQLIPVPELSHIAGNDNETKKSDHCYRVLSVSPTLLLPVIRSVSFSISFLISSKSV